MNTKQGIAQILIVGIVVILAIAGGGYFFVQKSLQAPDVNWEPSTVEVGDNEEESGSVIKDETSELETYRNEKYGFEFKYPKEIIIEGIDITGSKVRSVSKITIEENNQGLVIFGLNDIFSAGLIVEPNINNILFDAEKKRLSNGSDGYTESLPAIGGEDAFIYYGGMSTNTGVVVKDDYIYRFGKFGLWKQQNIIETFKFIK
ncbi:hypothetical protein ACFL22_00850 [Patescibacteria group bacterium]